MLKEKIGFIGVGQCGGNIVSNFEDNGYDCLFINASEKDLDTIKGSHPPLLFPKIKFVSLYVVTCLLSY